MIKKAAKAKSFILEKHGLRKTNFRIDVISIFLDHPGHAITQSEIEENLGEYDRITLYRTLKSFEEKGLIHLALDNKGQAKYALCNHNCTEVAHHDLHAHFHCIQCGKTLCMDDMPKSVDTLVPEGYQVNEIQITLSGKCNYCC